MKSILVSSLLFVGAVNAKAVSLAERRALFEFGVANTDCSTCFEKIDSARDCLRECNNKAYPGDNCCCCCECSGDDDQWSGNKDCDRNNNQCDGNSCKWELDNTSDNNKWYDIDKYCDCDKNKDNNKDNCDKNSDLKQNDDDRSLLDFCLGEDSPKSVEDIDDLAECCDFEDSKCDDYFTEVQSCLVGCLNPCLIITAGSWLDCIQDNANDGSCSRQECLNGFLDDQTSGTEDIFDLKSLENRVDKINEEDLQDCSLLTDFIESTCDVGNTCCSKCQPNLGSAVECLINDIVVPFSAAALNVSMSECPVDTEKCEPGYDRRQLTQSEADKFNKAMSLPKMSPAKEASRVVSTEQASANRKRYEEVSVSPENSAEVEKCQRKMEQDIMAFNMSYATNNFMSCVMELGYGSLSDGTTDGTTTTTATSAAATTLVSLFGLVSAMVLAALV